VEIRLLGPAEVRTSAGQTCDVRGSKVRGLLALLALNAGRVVSVDRIIDGLYGEDPSSGAPNAVQQLVSKLRRALVDFEGPGGAELVVTRPPGYLLDVDPDAVDAVRFARLLADARSATAAGRTEHAADALDEALALWRGDPLADIDPERAVNAERQRLAELHDVAIEERVEAGLALGHHAPLVAELEMLVAAAPLRERRWGQLMVARYRSGNQAGALRAYQQARDVLGEELGIEPSPELRRLEAAVLAQDPALDPPGVGPGDDAETTAARGGPSPALVAPRPSAIPHPLTGCLGRDHELEMLERLADAKRLVTLVGPGGVGKTRLATEYALGCGPRFRDGVHFVELAAVGDAAGVIPAIRSTLGLAGAASAAAGDDAGALVAAVAGLQSLVVLDNCEHVIDAVADLVASLLASGRGVHVLATSRQGLGVPGEQLIPVPTLDSATAAALFVERATAARPDLVIDERAAEAVDRICARVDGLPLAIELAASRIRLFDVAELAQRMDDRVDLSTTGPRTAAARHRTMQAVIDWSYELLDDRERTMFEVIGTFAGPVTMDAIESVCGDLVVSPEPAEVVTGLVDKSLVVVDRTEGVARFGMLQTVLSSARARAGANGTDQHLRRRHLDWLLDSIGDRQTALHRSGHRDFVRRVARDIAEIQAALAWALEYEPQLALDLSSRLSWAWIASGNPDVGMAALERSLAAAPSAAPDIVAWAHVWAAMIGPTAGSPHQAVEHGEIARRMTREAGDPVAYGVACVTRAFAGITAPGDRDEIRSLLDDARAHLAGHDWEHTFALLIESTAALFLEVFDAPDLIRRSLEGCRRTGNDFGLFAGLWRQAQYELRVGQLDAAELSLREALEVAASMPGARVGIEVVSYLAVVLAVKGSEDEAAQLVDEAVRSARRSGIRDPHTAISLAARSVVAAVSRRHDNAAVDLDHATGVFSAGSLHGLGVSTIEAFAAAMITSGRRPEAIRYHAAAVRLACEGSTVSLVNGTVARCAATARELGYASQADTLDSALGDGTGPNRGTVEAVLAELAELGAVAAAAR
jgi:predicted ATPase/DNA-binding SARP family transcriptional activator